MQPLRSSHRFWRRLWGLRDIRALPGRKALCTLFQKRMLLCRKMMAAASKAECCHGHGHNILETRSSKLRVYRSTSPGPGDRPCSKLVPSKQAMAQDKQQARRQWHTCSWRSIIVKREPSAAHWAVSSTAGLDAAVSSTAACTVTLCARVLFGAADGNTVSIGSPLLAWQTHDSQQVCPV